MTADTAAPSLREVLERIHARAIADDDADEKELRRQLYHIEALAKDAMTKLTLLPDTAAIRAAAFEEAAGIAKADEVRQSKLHELLETIREQIRLEIPPENRPENLFNNIQNAVYAMRGRTDIAAALRDAGRK